MVVDGVLQRPDHVGRVEFVPIGERHAAVQRERVRETVVGSLPGAGDSRLQLVGFAT